MPAVPASQHSTAEAILQMRGKQPEEHREHLGASAIGHPCDRYLWLSFRWARLPSWEGRMKRLFDRGKREEAVVAEELRAIGVELFTDEGGKQIDCRDESGHFGGSVDGVGRGFPESPKTWAVLEVKTHSSKSFADLRRNGVAEAKPQHYAQMQTYMGLLSIERAMYLAVNKDTDELYTEWVHFDQEAYQQLLARARRIVESQEPPVKLSDDPANWQCKGCQMYAICHEGRVAEANCRTCVSSTPVARGAWHCSVQRKDLDAGAQRAACDSHLFIPPLVPFGEPIDGGVGYVEYKHRETGKTFKNGISHYLSRELEKSCAGTVTEPVVEAMRARFGATVIASKPRKKRGADLSQLPEATEPFIDDDLTDIKF